MYSYLTKHAWEGLATASVTGPRTEPEATNNMVFTGFRYYIP